MIDFEVKINNNPTSAGSVEDFEYNHAFTEIENVVKDYLVLDSQDDRQMAKSIDIASKAMFYGDIGTVNSVHLTRGATSEQIETLTDGIVVFFSPANQNTGSTTLKLNHLLTKTMKSKGVNLVSGFLEIGEKYMAIYSLNDDVFNIDRIAGILDNSIALNKIVQGTPDKTVEFDMTGILVEVNGGFGNEQTLVNKTPLRSAGATYTNNTTRPIHIIIDRDTVAITDFFIQGVVVGMIHDTSDSGSFFTAMIPVGFTYGVEIGTAYNSWYEITSDLIT